MKKLFTSLLIITIFNNTIFAWSKTGHEIIAQIAKHYLDKSVATKVQSHLGKMSFEETANWMDQIKSNHVYDNLKSWHYVNIEKDATYVSTKDPNIINALMGVIESFNKTTSAKASINLNLKYLFHLIGDLHQPLHVGYGNDRGGNNIKVKCVGKKTNLHHVWDESIIQNKNITAAECLKLADAMSAKEIKTIQQIEDSPTPNSKNKTGWQINVITWMNESRSCLPQVYSFKNGNITQNYINSNAPLVKKQLLKAGLRLAAVLNKLYKVKYCINAIIHSNKRVFPSLSL